MLPAEPVRPLEPPPSPEMDPMPEALPLSAPAIAPAAPACSLLVKREPQAANVAQPTATSTLGPRLRRDFSVPFMMSWDEVALEYAPAFASFPRSTRVTELRARV